MEENPIKLWVHPALAEEFKVRKEILEKKVGYKINGGIPIVSKICAVELKKRRLHEKGKIEIQVEKRKGEQKFDIFFM